MRGHGRPYLGPFSTWAARATATQGAAHGAGRLQSWDGAGGGRRDGVAGRVLSERMTSVRSAQARNGVLCRKSGSVSCGRPRELLDPGRQSSTSQSSRQTQCTPCPSPEPTLQGGGSAQAGALTANTPPGGGGQGGTDNSQPARSALSGGPHAALMQTLT